MSLGTNISRLRAEKRLSQGDLAEVLEVSRQSVSKWETDSSVPDLNRLMKLSQLFGVTLDELVTGAEPPVKVETPPVMVSPSMPGRKIAGIILFCMAFLAFLIPTGLGGILIGLILAPSAIKNCQSNWILAFVALGVVIVCNIWGKGMVKILPILIGVLVSYAVALVTGAVDFQRISEAAWVGIPLHKEAMGLFAIDGSPEFISALFTIIPIALATMMEHVGDIAAISATVGHNYINDPGLNRTLLGDGLATSLSALGGGPANTTYGENTGVLALTKVYDPRVMRIAALVAILLSFFPKFGAAIETVPSAIIGGVSFMLYGMISAIGIRNVVENRVDFTNSRNLIVAAVILVCALGFNSVGGVTFAIAGVNINLSGLAIAAIAGILLNAILPGNDYEFDEGSNEPESASLRV